MCLNEVPMKFRVCKALTIDPNLKPFNSQSYADQVICVDEVRQSILAASSLGVPGAATLLTNLVMTVDCNLEALIKVSRWSILSKNASKAKATTTAGACIE